MVLLDYIAGRGVRLPRRERSDRRLWARLRAAARRVGTSAVFPPARGIAITDDHTPFLRAGVPAIDLIDWSYPGQEHDPRPRRPCVESAAWTRWGRRCSELARALRG